MGCVTFFQRQEIESAKLKKKFEGGPLFDESHANEFENRFNEKFDCTRVDYKGVHPLIGSCGGETNKLPW